MEVKSHLITAMGKGAPGPLGCPGSRQNSERVLELEEKRKSLETLLKSRLRELRRVCLLEAELTGQLPREFPLEAGERGCRMAQTHSVPKEEEVGQMKQRKTLLCGAVRRLKDTEPHHLHKRMVDRGCHTDEALKPDTHAVDSAGLSDGESSPSTAPDLRSPPQPRLAPGSPENRICRKLSPEDIYYETRTRRNSEASSSSPSQSLPRSMSNMEGQSGPATPLLSRTAQNSLNVRSELMGGNAAEQWSESCELPQVEPLQPQEGSSSGSFERGGCQYSARARRSNSSEALLDRCAFPEDRVHRTGMPPRGGPYKSSEALTDGRLRYVHWGSPERHLNQPAAKEGRMRSSVGGRGGAGYSEILMDYIWGKQQRLQVQQQQQQPLWHQSRGSGNGMVWPEGHSPPVSSSNLSPHFHESPPSQAQQTSSGPPPYSPMLLRSKLGELRRFKVTRTKSCGPFIPQHQTEAILLSAYSESLGSTPSSSTAALYPYQTELPGSLLACRPSQCSSSTPEDSTRSLHKALALEGLRDWYLRNALGYAATPSKVLDSALPRRPHPFLHGSHPHPLTQQPQALQAEQDYLQCHSAQMPHSATFHGHPLHGSRSVEHSIYQELTLTNPSAELPAPGTLV